jgi:hypothetical protein
MIRELLQISTIPELIELYKSFPITHETIHFKTSFVDNNSDIVRFNFSSVLDRYYDFILSNCISITFTDKDWINYRFQPKRLSMNIYKTTELWSLILKLNNMTSMLEFDQQTLLLPPVQTINDIINEIMILEKNAIEANISENT